MGARRKGKRREVWIWTAVVEERDGSRWVDFEVGDRSEETFLRLWSYVGARRKGKRREVWIWTAVVEERDGSRWVDFEVGDRSEETFLRLYGPAARGRAVPQRRLPSV